MFLSKNFIGFDAQFEDADVVMFGAPFDSTASNRAGARHAPSAVRVESNAIETYSPYQDKDLSEIKAHDAGDLELSFGNPKEPLKVIEGYATKIFQANKKPLMIGGEHLVTLGAVRAAIQKYPDLKVVHFDAHTDLRDDYLGEKLSHAAVVKRIWELVGDNAIAQFGIRSGERSEFEWAKTHTLLSLFDFEGLDAALKKFGNCPIYLTIDLDVLDPSVLSGTGTPEAGGVSFVELLTAVKKVIGANVVACDIVELAPEIDKSGASIALTCKLIREITLLMG